MKLIKFEAPSDVKETIEEALKQVEELETVMIIGVRKDGYQYMLSSTMDGYQKMFLVQFLNAWANKWFELR